MNYSKQKRVVVATDRTAIPAAVHAMLTLEFDVVSVVYDADTLLSEALRLEPDLVVVEAALSLRDEFRATGEIMRRLPRTKIIHHATHDAAGDASHHATGDATGAEELSQGEECEGIDSEATFSQALRLAGTARDCPADAGEAPGAASPQDPAGLTSREREVLELLANGFAMKVIAYRLGITYRTVAFHKYKMMQRLGIRTNAGLTTYALRTGALKSAPMRAEFPRRTRYAPGSASPRLRAAG
jgi:DNA-binding NarL/FixJ family response regulator